jgi:hypothetical protein
MSKQSSFKQGEPSPNVTMLLEHIQFANPGSSGIDEDNQAQNWGHYQFTAGGISPSSALTTWQDFGNVATAFKLVAAALKICQDTRAMCADTEMPPDFLCDVFFNQILERLKKCWVGAGGVRIYTISQACFINYPSRPLLLLEPQPFLPHLPVATRQLHVSRSKSSLLPPLRLPHKRGLLSPSCPVPFQNLHRSCRSHQRHYNHTRCIGF